MRRIFLSTSFTAQVNYRTGVIHPEFKESIKQITAALRNIDDFTVFCAVEYEGWVVSKEPPEVSIKKDLAEIKKADLIVALVTAGDPSGGVQFEMGVACALGKKVFAATQPGTELNFFNQGVVNLGHIEHLRYEDPPSLARQIKAAA
jgi:nucleoside 2-deoxyribosyltransferase